MSALVCTLVFAASPDVHVGRTGSTRLGPAPLITDDGRWAGMAAEEHLKAVGFDARGSNYSVVAVVGPQSSGKSTLLNALYGASFDEMSAVDGRSQTTRGIWLECPAAQPDLLLLDVQGTDSIEGGEGSKTFERQAALFVLGLADVLVINVWEHDVGRHVCLYTAPDAAHTQPTCSLGTAYAQPTHSLRTACIRARRRRPM